ncbi:MAG: hypothetical protein RR184_14310 [Citrobacter sp.]
MDELPYSRDAERAAFVYRPFCRHHRAVNLYSERRQVQIEMSKI